MIDLAKKNENFSRLGILLFCGFLSFMLNPTAYTWGEQDMMPFFERLSNPDFLPGDFFTNTTVLKNPRWIYGYIITGLSSLTGLSWYTTLYIGKLILLLSMPVLYYKVMLALLGRYLDRDKLERISWFILFGTILTVVFAEYRHVFSVAWWDNYKPVINSANISLAACFIGILLKETKKTSFLHLLFFAAGTLVHPAMGIFCMIFYLSFLLPHFRLEWINMSKIFVSCIIAAILIKLLFSSSIQLSTADFIEYYVVERHPWHYHVPKFDHWYGDWRYFFLLMNLLLWGIVLFGIFKKNKLLIQLGVISVIGYSGSIVLQYFFIEIYPSKMMAYLGVSRYTIFGYWNMIMLSAYILSNLKGNILKIKLPGLSLGGLLIVVVNFTIFGILYLDNPRDVKSQIWRDFYSFVDDTSKESTFLTYSEGLNTDLRIIGNRQVFIAKEFPFVESKIEEYIKRYRMAYGSKLSGLQGEEYFRELTPADFIEMKKKYPLDYIVVEAKYAANLSEYTPVWSNKNLKVFSLTDLR